jgi:exosortase family protein XrtG
MTWAFLIILVIVYFVGTYVLKRRELRLTLFLWSAFGLAFIVINAALMIHFEVTLAAMEARHVTASMNLSGINLDVINQITVMVPDPTGWSGLKIGAESSSLLELSVFAGLILFYPKLSYRRRVTSLTIGLIGTYILNLVRLALIIIMIHTGGKPAYALGHTVVGRLVYFAGIVTLYWYLFTQHTLHVVQNQIQSSERANS